MDKRFWTRSLVLLGAIAVAVAAWPQNSIGADAKVIGASGCRRLGTSNALGLEYISNGVKDIAGTQVLVICNLPRDNTGNTNGLSDLEVTIRNSVNNGVSCTALSSDRNGNPLKVVNKGSTGLGNAVIDFGSVLNVSSSKGSYAVICTLFDQSMVNSVYVNEF